MRAAAVSGQGGLSAALRGALWMGGAVIFAGTYYSIRRESSREVTG